MHIHNKPILTIDVQEPPFLFDWLRNQNPMTDKLASAKGSAHLKVLSQNWVQSSWWANHLFETKEEKVFQREIMMQCGDKDYWYARTLIPQSSYDLNPDFFRRLETESLRNLIFEEREVHRLQLIHYPVNQQCIEYHWVRNYIETINSNLWVRFAEFSYRDSVFYLIEILLPDLENIE